MDKIYDIAIIGGGPSGITAGIYAKRAGLDVIILEKAVPGGVISSSFEVENYPGFELIAGMELATKMYEHVTKMGVAFEFDEVNKVLATGDVKVVQCLRNSYKAKAIILAHGAKVRKLDLENEKDYIGRGISYCATCDGNFFKGKTVALVGGGNTALEDAFYLSNVVGKVYLIHRRDEFRADNILVNRVKQQSNVEIVYNSVVTSISGGDKLDKVVVENVSTKKKRTLDVAGLFVCIGRGPDTDMIEGDLNKTENGYIITDENMKTNIDGVYAAGDIRNTRLRQIVTACADGAIAATKIFEYLKTKEKSK